jgi:SAM-dependent MidA family methyltransferase
VRVATGPVTWRAATHRALYGEDGFYRRQGSGNGVPAAHFRTSVHASPLFARALLALVRAAGPGAVVDVGSGGGELLGQLHRLDPSLRLVGVDVAPRPGSLPAGVEWRDTLPDRVDGLLVANEWLDDVPVDVVAGSRAGPRLVLVDPRTGTEQVGGPPEPSDLRWLERWWPVHPGGRAEVGRSRDEAWADAVGRIGRGLAVAVDYGHLRDERPPAGTLAGYRDGRAVPPVPDGSCDVTAHVAMDAVAEAGRAAGAGETLLTTQARALHRLGLRPDPPDRGLARTDPPAYVRALAEEGARRELTDPAGLGGFRWLVQAVRVPLPAALTGTDS